MTIDWLEALGRNVRAGTPSVLLTVTAARGSAPREAGAKMVVTAGQQDGTIGGGSLEHECSRMARDLLSLGRSLPVLHDFPLGPALGQCCGGHVTVLFEPVLPPTWHVMIFGAGHVGMAVVDMLARLPCRVTWVDERPRVFDGQVAGNVTRVSLQPREVAVPAASMVLVMTHDHQLDYEIVRSCLVRTDLRMVGLIGSETKRARFIARLARDGTPAAALARLVCPVGLPGTGSKLPVEIAIAVVAQLLQKRDEPFHEVAAMAVDGVADGSAPGCGSRTCVQCEMGVH